MLSISLVINQPKMVAITIHIQYIGLRTTGMVIPVKNNVIPMVKKYLNDACSLKNKKHPIMKNIKPIKMLNFLKSPLLL